MIQKRKPYHYSVNLFFLFYSWEEEEPKLPPTFESHIQFLEAMSFSVRRVVFLCACLFHASQYLRTDSNTDEPLVVIGILSSQNNSAARSSIRHTWKNLVSKNSKFYFLVGKYFCPVHPYDRISEQSCEELIIKWPTGLSYNSRLWTSEVNGPVSSMYSQNVVTLFTFRTNFPIVLRGMRVMKNILKIFDSGVAQLRNAHSGDLITSLQFDIHTDDLSVKENLWIEGRTEPFLLPRSFDGEFLIHSSHHESVLENVDFHCEQSAMLFDLFGAIQYTSLYGPSTGWIPPSNHCCVPMSLLFELHDFQHYQDQKRVRRKFWTNEIEKVSRDLNIEADVEGDILLLDVIDVYGTLPKKLLAFYKWIHENLKFQYVLKADDDTFVDLSVVEEYLGAITNSEETFMGGAHLWWWGNLRYGLPVARHGKWQELHYKAPVYPPFPCGSGYVLHKNVISFLVSNLNWLHHFQGEDTSLGIWLSGVNLIHPHNVACRWACSNKCEKSQCNRIQLSVKEMYSTWLLYQSTHTLCE